MGKLSIIKFECLDKCKLCGEDNCQSVFYLSNGRVLNTYDCSDYNSDLEELSRLTNCFR